MMPLATPVFWDLETTDRKSTCRIVSIGWTLSPTAPKELLVLPLEESTTEAIRVHGWTRAKLADAGALGIETQLKAFFASLRHLGPIVLCAHNGKAFDTRVLRSEMTRAWLTLPPNILGFVDTLHWLRSTVGIRPTNLDHLIEQMGESARSIHSSGHDAVLLCRIASQYMHTHPLSHFETVDAWYARTNGVQETTIEQEVGRCVDCLLSSVATRKRRMSPAPVEEQL